MSEMQSAAAYAFVTLVDRTGQGGCEIIYDGVRNVLKPGNPTIIVPRFIAEFVFNKDQQKVHTTDGRYLCRFAIKDGPADLIEVLGPDCIDDSPITIDTDAVEGWDADHGGAKTRVITLQKRPQDFAHQGSARVGTFSGKERGSEP